MFLVYECMGACPGGWGGYPCHPKKTFFDPSPKHTLKVASGSHLEPLFGSRRPRVLFRRLSVDFLHKVGVSKICFMFSFGPQRENAYIDEVELRRPRVLFMEIHSVFERLFAQRSCIEKMFAFLFVGVVYKCVGVCVRGGGYP